LNKPFYIFLFFILFCCEAKTQTEYITNGSFEDIDSCYGNIANLGFDVFEWSGCKGWSNPIKSSSDLWCTNGKLGLLEPPNVSLGYQNPKSGKNMAGFFISDVFVKNYREYIQNKFNQQLKVGVNYEINMFVSSRNSFCSISEIGVKFSNSKYNDINALWLTNLIPDALNDCNNFIIDSLNWQKITLNYIASGYENYMIIGCFADSVNLKYTMSNCDTTFWNGGNYASDYIFIDDVSIIEKEMPELPNVFTPNGDNVNDVFKLTNCGAILNTSIYNRWGNIVFQTENQNHFWDGRTTSGEECVDGIYYYMIETKEKTIKGCIQLIR
jgi:gliding motility-associated-like protein